MSRGGPEHGAVEGGTGDAKAGGDLGDGYVGGFEQCADGLDLFGRQFYRTTTFPASCASGCETGDGAFADEVAFELRQCGENVKDKPAGR